MVVFVTIPPTSGNWQNLGSVPYLPEGTMCQVLDMRSGTQTQLQLYSTSGGIDVMNQYVQTRYATVIYPIDY